MGESPLMSLSDYSRFVAEALSRAGIESSTVAVWSDSPGTGIAEGEVFFTHGIRLRLREELDFEAGLIAAYGYEIYRGNERLFWYDDFPHPDDPSLTSTYPHHKHVPPDIRHHRIPAPGLSFTAPNLPTVLEEIEAIGG
jgi:Family of unknown function (DUF6516)